MLISEVTEQTGLSKKAIRFYEEKGLIKISRRENGYRELLGRRCADTQQN